LWSTATLSPAAVQQSTLDIYFLDMVGGGSTLIVTRLGESFLIDTGSLLPANRDADRIFRATQCAGLKQIDCLITTHFHSDHFGALHPLSQKIPVKKFMDKGAWMPENERKAVEKLIPLYQEVTGGKVEVIKAGDDIPVKNDPSGKLPPIRLHCVAAEKKVVGFDGDIDAPVAGFEIRPADDTDNARSIALVLRYGRFDAFLGGDITWNVEHHLAHPKNIVGEVDVYQVTHHGLDLSNNPVLLKALNPTVCIAMNGPRKGIQPNTFAALRQLPAMQALYQIHFNTQYGEAGNTAPEFIANYKDPNAGEFIKVSVDAAQGIYTVSIGEKGTPRTFSIK
ncbi:MAG: MBL fold metallo-hydrolase, partial [Candidatus Sumerlaeia bacterium]|nr:MBL fold metallo-hydrolase [Candidatus Sumerlaeia bacterium]